MLYVYLLIVGTVIGLFGKFLAPSSRDNTPLWLTILCGIGGVVIANVIFEWQLPDSSDVWRWLMSIGIAAVLVVLASTITGRNTRKKTRA
ncbi:GlsB/YeaQ/YmgE family stress response membrane protein [Nocardioidaceae bacterium]|nr:GlsB/YeaQ/YmgE family stress response membrane protein [Nocardioidaceae bacterium]